MLTVLVAFGDALRVQGVVKVIDRSSQQVLRGITHQLCYPVTHMHKTFSLIWFLSTLCTTEGLTGDLGIETKGEQSSKSKNCSHSHCFLGAANLQRSVIFKDKLSVIKSLRTKGIKKARLMREMMKRVPFLDYLHRHLKRGRVTHI